MIVGNGEGVKALQYWQVKPEHHGKLRPDGSQYLAGELYTAGEIRKNKLNTEYMEPITVPLHSIYWSFGARFIGSQPKRKQFRVTNGAGEEVIAFKTTMMRLISEWMTQPEKFPITIEEVKEQ